MTRQVYEEAFLDFRDELSSYIFRLVTNRQNTEDIVQDTYIKTFDKLSSFKEKSSFKTWVFTIATNMAKTGLKKQQRWIENAQDFGAELHNQSREHWDRFHDVFNATPEKKYEVKEHLVYCFNCINKTLVIDQQVCLLLKEVYAFKVVEIMEITDLSEGKVKHAIADARKHMVRIFNNRCSFVNKQGVCHQCTELNGVLNQTHEAQILDTEIKMLTKKETSKEELLNLRLALVKSIDPLHTPNTLVNTFMLENAEKWVEEGTNLSSPQKL